MTARVVVVADERAVERETPGDVVLDLDRLLVAFGGSGPHVRLVALRALRAAREAAIRLREDVTVWDVRPAHKDSA